MKFLFIYRGGEVPNDRLDQNVDELWRWLDNLTEKGYEKVRFAGSGSKIISQDSIKDYSGDIFGISIIEADSLEEAKSLTDSWPELQYGGKIEILEAIGD
ncbi:YciI family protein [Alkalicoccobacillus plakortidis]|uniref:YciI family protein n=1 Tax=Alkalicoccobacillus plakortidis TaxID=444060 RepID=A0ABT0XPK8_9BACI|nr:YciI family protein [Alkalicoccobacillus plakortidis]MCM2677640.1 YciI family protein [Alkalicoccobacillus plakortidis]